MRLIDADAVMKMFADIVAPSCHSDFAKVPTWNDAVAVVDDAPTVDAEPVVRCKDCEFRNGCESGKGDVCDYSAVYVHPNGFCNWGKRRNDGT